MQKSYLNVWLLIFVLVFTTFSLTNISAKEQNLKAKERVQQIKKMKLLELLNLDEAASEKFLSKYTVWEKKLNEKRDAIESAIDELQSNLRKKISNNDIVQQSNKILSLRSDLFSSIQESQKDIKSILNDTQFATYLVFEHKFRKEMEKMLMDKMRKGNFNGNRHKAR